MKRISRFYALAVFLSLAGLVEGQVNPGIPSWSAYDSHAVDTINLQNLNVFLDLPVMSKSGAFAFNFDMTGNFYVWATGGNWHPSVNGAGTGLPTLYAGANGILTTDLSGGFLWGFTSTYVACPPPNQTTYTYKRSNFFIGYGDQTIHSLPAGDVVDTVGCYNTSFTDQVTDGTGYTLSMTGNGGIGGLGSSSIYDRSGIVISSSSITDSNRNAISWNSTSRLYTDTLGLTAITVGGTTSAPTYSWTDVNGGSPTVSATSTSYTLKSAFNCTGISDYNIASQSLPTSISFPDSTTFGLAYETTPGYPSDRTGRLSQVTLRTGGTINYSYSGGSNGINCTYQVPPTLTRTTGDGTTRYDWAAVNNGSGNWGNTTTVTDNGGNKTVYTFTGLTSTGNAASPVMQALTQVKHYQGSSTLLTTDLYCYNTNTSNCSTAVVSGPITEVDVYHTINGMSNSSRTKTTFDAYGNVLISARYDFGASSATVQTSIIYGTWNGTACVAVATSINNKPCDVVTIQGGSTVAESRFSYDSKGNLLASYRWTGSAWLSSSTSNVYNSNGTVSNSYDLANNHTTYAYAATGSGGCNGLFPTSITKGGLTTYSTWNCTGGVKLTDKDASGNTTTYGYASSSGVADPFWRLMSVTDPLSNVVYKAYTATSTNSTFSFNSGSSLQNTTITTDGYGRPINAQTQQGPLASNYDTVSTAYNWSGNYRTIATSQPCVKTLGSSCSTVHTNYSDPLDRLYQETTASNETVTKTYAQNDVATILSPAPAGENNKSIQKEYDGLGRIVKHCQILSSGGSACNQNTGTSSGYLTSYTYSSFAGGTQVQVTLGSQTRTKKYDALGRLTYDSEPESGTTTYVYDTDSSCTLAGSSTTSPGNLISSTDGNGNKTCRTYDSLNRLTDVVISKGGACIPPVKRFRYDNTSNDILPFPSGYSTTNTGGRMVEAWTGDCVWPTPASGYDSASDEWFAYSKRGERTDLWESTSHIAGYYHGTASYAANGALGSIGGVPGYTTITFGLDGEGRPYTATQGTTNLVTGVTYTAGSQPLTVSLGAGDSDNYGYDDVNTGRMTNYTFTVGSTPKSQIGNLTWNANGTLRTLAITDGFNSSGAQTCNFGTSTVMGYDDLGRLVSDNCGSVWSQTFSYDQYNNITKAGSSSWMPGYDPATNHASPPITYDSSGNLTYDTFHNYAWYVDNKLGSTDSTTCNIFGSTNGTCILYDAFGREVERGVNGVYTEVMYTPVGKTAIMNGQTTTLSAYFPLPGGETYYQTGTANGSGYFWHKDWLGSVRLSSSVLSRTYYFDRAFAPYGEMYNNFGNTAGLNFTGDTQDSFTGLYDTFNRELHPSEGRWLSPDPARAGWNLYAYVTNPNSLIDPLGLACTLARPIRPGPRPAEGCGSVGGIDNYGSDAGVDEGGPSVGCCSSGNSSSGESGTVQADPTYNPPGWNGGQQQDWTPGTGSDESPSSTNGDDALAFILNMIQPIPPGEPTLLAQNLPPAANGAAQAAKQATRGYPKQTPPPAPRPVADPNQKPEMEPNEPWWIRLWGLFDFSDTQVDLPIFVVDPVLLDPIKLHCQMTPCGT